MLKPRTCPHCGRKNFTDNPLCSFCEKPLDSAQPSTTPTPPPIKTPPPIARTTSTEDDAHSPPVPVPVPSYTRSPVPYTPTTPFAPVGGATAYPASPLPSDLLARYSTPDLEGEVIDTRDISVREQKTGTGDIIRILVGCLALPFQPIVALLTLFGGGSKPKEAKTIATFRVRRADGMVSQARIEHDIVGATVDVGDYVSVWGRERKGVLAVEHAYNHTVGGEVILKR